MRLTNYTRDALAAELKSLVEGANAQGWIRVYAGTVPETANDGVGDATLLASFELGVTAFTVTDETSGTHGFLQLTNPLVDPNNSGSGTPSFAIIEDVAGNKIADLLVPSELNIEEITAGGMVTIRTFTMTVPEEC